MEHIKGVRRTVKGNYEARRTIYGCTVSAYGKTPQEADQRLNDKLNALKEAENGAITYSEWLTEWQQVYKAQYIQPKTLQGIADCIRLHFPAALKNKPLDALRPLDIQKALNEVPLSRTRKAAYDIYAESLRKAYDLDRIPTNPMRKVEPVRHKRKLGAALTVEERINFLAVIHGLPLKNLFVFYIATGARRSEAFNLAWKDIDFQNDWLTIRGTKTASSLRTVRLLPEAKTALINQQQKTGHNAKVFPYTADYVTRVFHKLCPAHKLHDLRHTFATICLERGIMLSTVQHWLGHSSIQTTSSVYTHVLDDFQKQEALKFSLV